MVNAGSIPVLPRKKSRGEKMSRSAYRRIVDEYMAENPYAFVDVESTKDILHFANRKGYIRVMDIAKPFTFGGLTVELTDADFSKVVQLLSGNRKVAAIKLIREKNFTGLKDTKGFIDHLYDILKDANLINGGLSSV